MRGKIIALIFVLLAFEALVILAMYFSINSNGKCDYNNSSKVYIKKTPSCVINFLCTQDKVAFSDECGCGCRLK